MGEIAKSPVLNAEVPTLAPDKAMVTLYARHWSELCRYIKKQFGAGPPDPEDIAQEAFMKFASVEDREGIDNPRAYLFRTAHNVCVDEHRRLALRNGNSRRPESVSGCDDRSPDRILVAQERLEVLARSLRSMPAARRRSFLLNRLHGLSCAQIARMTGYADSSVKKHIAVALSELEMALTKAEGLGGSEPA